MIERLRRSLALHILALAFAWLGRTVLQSGEGTSGLALSLLGIDFAANLLAWRIVRLVQNQLGREIETNEFASFVYVLPLLAAYFTIVDLL